MSVVPHHTASADDDIVRTLAGLVRGLALFLAIIAAA